MRILLKFTLIYLLPILVLSACSHSDKPEARLSDAELRQRLTGTWRNDSHLDLSGGIHVKSETVVDGDGAYLLLLTNTLSDGVRKAAIEGTLQVKNGLLIDTITKDITGNTLVPRPGGVGRIIRLDAQELVVRSTNDDKTVIYQKDSK